MKFITLAIAPLLFLSGCVTMFHGTSQMVAFTSDPPGATASFKKLSCVTPCSLDAPRSPRPAMVRFDLAGHESYFTEIASLDIGLGDNGAMAIPATIGAILVVPLIVDLASGSMYDWPKAIHAVLPEKGKGTAMIDVRRTGN